MNAITISGENVIIEASEYYDMVKECAELRDEVRRLQTALAFWLPGVKAGPADEIYERTADDSMLLFGHDGNERSAEERGWITLNSLPQSETKGDVDG